LIQLLSTYEVRVERCSSDPLHRAFRLVVHPGVDILGPVDVSEGVLGRVGVQVEELVVFQVFLGGMHLNALLFRFEALHNEDCSALELGRVAFSHRGFLGTRVLLHLGGVLEHLCERYSHHEVVDAGAVALGQIVSIVSVSVSGLHGLHLAHFLSLSLSHQLVMCVNIEHF